MTNQLAMGGQGFYASLRNKAFLSYCAKYSTDEWSAMCIYGSDVAQLHYMRKLKEKMNLASELIYNTASGESTANIGTEIMFRTSRFVTNLDHTGKISSTLEVMVFPMTKFSLSAEMQHSSGDYKFGYGIQLQGQ